MIITLVLCSIGAVAGLVFDRTHERVKVKIDPPNDAAEVYVNCKQARYLEAFDHRTGENDEVDLGWLRTQDLVTLQIRNFADDFEGGFQVTTGNEGKLDFHTPPESQTATAPKGVTYVRTVSPAPRLVGELGCGSAKRRLPPFSQGLADYKDRFWRGWKADAIVRLPIVAACVAILAFLVGCFRAPGVRELASGLIIGALIPVAAALLKVESEAVAAVVVPTFMVFFVAWRAWAVLCPPDDPGQQRQE